MKLLIFVFMHLPDKDVVVESNRRDISQKVLARTGFHPLI